MGGNRKRRAAAAFVFGTAFLAIAAWVAYLHVPLVRTSFALVPPHIIDTTHYRILVDRWPLPDGVVRPALDHIDDRFVLAGNNGSFFMGTRPAPGRDGTIDWQRLPFSMPTNLDVFKERVPIRWRGLGVRDIFVDRKPDTPADLYVLHSLYLQETDCVVTRVSLRIGFLETDAAEPWETLYETEPCLPLSGPVDRIGGRILVRDGSLYITIGSPEWDPEPGRPVPATPVAQQWDSPFGKILRLDLTSGSITVLAAGMRNPQGLYITQAGEIWATDHGPKGGDELNRIREGGNYGAPRVTYGAAYDHHTWPGQEMPGRHDGFDGAEFAWLPAIAISELVVLEEERYGRWQGDLLVTSLKGETLFRVRRENGHVVFAESIPLGHRLRDIVAIDGVVHILADDYLLLRLTLDRETD